MILEGESIKAKSQILNGVGYGFFGFAKWGIFGSLVLMVVFEVRLRH